MEEIHQMKEDKMKEKGSQHDPEHATVKKETQVEGDLQNTEQHFITMAELQHS